MEPEKKVATLTPCGVRSKVMRYTANPENYKGDKEFPGGECFLFDQEGVEITEPNIVYCDTETGLVIFFENEPAKLTLINREGKPLILNGVLQTAPNPEKGKPICEFIGTTPMLKLRARFYYAPLELRSKK